MQGNLLICLITYSSTRAAFLCLLVNESLKRLNENSNSDASYWNRTQKSSELLLLNYFEKIHSLRIFKLGF